MPHLLHLLPGVPLASEVGKQRGNLDLSELVLQPNHSFKFFNQECRLLPTKFSSDFVLDDKLEHFVLIVPHDVIEVRHLSLLNGV